MTEAFGWDELAEWWVAAFTAGADAEYEQQILPLIGAELDGLPRVLDVGCGEGQISRLAAALGAVRVTGIDPTDGLLQVAASRADGSAYVRAEAEAMPLASATFDAVVACLVLEHVDGLDVAIAEIARTLVPGGFCGIFLNHPLFQTPGSGLIDDHTVSPPERYWRVGPYLVESVDDEPVEPGVWVRFHHRPLARYVNGFGENGLLLERMVELRPLTDDALAASVPRLVYLRFRKS